MNESYSREAFDKARSEEERQKLIGKAYEEAVREDRDFIYSLIQKEQTGDGIKKEELMTMSADEERGPTPFSEAEKSAVVEYVKTSYESGHNILARTKAMRPHMENNRNFVFNIYHKSTWRGLENAIEFASPTLRQELCEYIKTEILEGRITGNDAFTDHDVLQRYGLLDKEYIIRAIRAGVMKPGFFISKEQYSDPEFVLQLLQVNNERHASEFKACEEKGDLEKAKLESGAIDDLYGRIKYYAPELLQNKHFVLEAAKIDRRIRNYLSEELREDSNFMTDLREKTQEDPYQYRKSENHLDGVYD